MTPTRKQTFLSIMRAGVSRHEGEMERYFQNMVDKVLPMSLKQFEQHEKAIWAIIKRSHGNVDKATRELRDLHK